MPFEITSRDNAKIKYALSIAGSAAVRREEKLFFAETGKLVLDIAGAGVAPKQLFYTQEALTHYPDLLDLSGEHYLVSESVSSKLSAQKNPSGVYMLAPLPVQQEVVLKENGRYLVLEHLQDPANIGAVLRTGAAFGFDGVFISKDSADPFSQKALRASMGAAVKMPIYFVEDVPALCATLKEKGIQPLAAAADGEQDISEYTPEGGVAVLIGSEGQGLTDAAMNEAAVKVRITMAAGSESLNAAVAASIFMWQLRAR